MSKDPKTRNKPQSVPKQKAAPIEENKGADASAESAQAPETKEGDASEAKKEETTTENKVDSTAGENKETPGQKGADETDKKPDAATTEKPGKSNQLSADEKKAKEIMKQHNVEAAFKVGQYWFTSPVYAKQHSAETKDKIETFTK